MPNLILILMTLGPGFPKDPGLIVDDVVPAASGFVHDPICIRNLIVLSCSFPD